MPPAGILAWKVPPGVEVAVALFGVLQGLCKGRLHRIVPFLQRRLCGGKGAVHIAASWW